MNSDPKRIVDRALEVDPIAAAAEYLGQWRSDIESFVRRECVEARMESLSGLIYMGTVTTPSLDPSGGASDSMTLAIAHKEEQVAVLDVVREVRPPFSPEATVSQFVSLLNSYYIREVSGDKYAGEWPRERFRVGGVEYKPSERSKSEIYGELLPLISSNRVTLLDEPKTISQLIGLERKTARSGKDSIDHGPNAHDDCINAVAGALVSTVVPRNTMHCEP